MTQLPAKHHTLTQKSVPKNDAYEKVQILRNVDEGFGNARQTRVFLKRKHNKKKQ